MPKLMPVLMSVKTVTVSSTMSKRVQNHTQHTQVTLVNSCTSKDNKTHKQHTENTQKYTHQHVHTRASWSQLKHQKLQRKRQLKTDPQTFHLVQSFQCNAMHRTMK